MGKDRGRRPRPTKGKVPQSREPLPDFNNETPKFCLHHLRAGFDVNALADRRQAGFAKTLQKLACSKWRQLITAPRHGQGSEFILSGQIKAPIPARFEGEERFLVFRYHEKLPMGGVRVRDVYHILWIEPEFNQLYDHG